MKLIKIELLPYPEIGRQAHHIQRMRSLLFIYLLVWIAGIVSITFIVYLLTKKSVLLLSLLLLVIPLYFLYELHKPFVKTSQLAAIKTFFKVSLTIKAKNLTRVVYNMMVNLSESIKVHQGINLIPRRASLIILLLILFLSIFPHAAPENARSAFNPLPTSIITHPGPSTILYQEDGLDNWQGWDISDHPDWVVSEGKLLNTDGNGTPPLIAPYEPGKYGISDYAIIANITLLKYNSDNLGGFGLVARETSDGGGYTFSNCISVGFNTCGGDDFNKYNAMLIVGQSFPNGNVISKTPFTPLAGVEYTYTFDVKGSAITVLVNGKTLINTVTDNTYVTNGGQVGIWSSVAEIAITSFEVVAL